MYLYRHQKGIISSLYAIHFISIVTVVLCNDQKSFRFGKKKTLNRTPFGNSYIYSRSLIVFRLYTEQLLFFMELLKFLLSIAEFLRTLSSRPSYSKKSYRRPFKRYIHLIIELLKFLLLIAEVLRTFSSRPSHSK